MTDIARMVPRVVDANEETELFTRAHLIGSVPYPASGVDALAVMPGLGEHGRIIAAIRAWESGNARHLLVTGTNGIEREQRQPTLEFLTGDPINLHRTEGVITQVSAENTGDQADWLMQQIIEHQIGSLALFVSHWHLPRAYSVVLRSMREHNIRIPIFPVAVPSSPKAIVPETGETVVVMSAGEAERIKKYQKLGYVVSLQELADYLDWLWTQDIVPIK